MGSKRDNGDEIVFCKDFDNDISAQIETEVLRANNIPYILDNQVFSNIYPIGFNSLGAVRLMVFRRDLERALELLDKAES